MRHSRLTPVPLVAVAHGSRDARAPAAIGDLLAVARERAAARGLGGIDVRAAFLGHCEPPLPRVLGALAAGPRDAAGRRPCVVLPLLLTAAYHSKTDIPAQAAAADGAGSLGIRYASPLGPHPLLLAALERRLAGAGVGLTPADRAATSVVLAAAGSSDQAANAACAALAARWQRAGGWHRVVAGYASAAEPSPARAVAALRAAAPGPVVVATYLLAPGYFADKIGAAAREAGADAVSGVLGAAPEVADVILDRYAAALAAGTGEPAAGDSAAGDSTATRGTGDGRRRPLAQPGAALPNRLWPPPSYPERTVVTCQLVTCSSRGNRPGMDVTARAPQRE